MTEAYEVTADELRQFILDSVARTGGHLASNLGVIELTVALHAIFDTPRDAIVWDVGHQAYAHKILTGRRERMHTLRQTDGVSGFPKREESAYDAFVAEWTGLIAGASDWPKDAPAAPAAHLVFTLLYGSFANAMLRGGPPRGFDGLRGELAQAVLACLDAQLRSSR